jgi:sulfotransferase family protein
VSGPIFVVGCPRSGTTLVQCILSASSEAFSLPETHFFSYVLPALGVAADAVLSTSQVRSAREAFETEADLPDLGEFWTRIERQSVTALELFLAVVEHFRTAPGLRWIEKTPLHVMHMHQIAACFPDAVFVNVVRNPIDVASSLMGVPWASSRSVLSYAQRWSDAVAAADAFARAHPERIWTVVYEALVRDAEAHTRALCEFVELPYAQRMLQEFGKQAARNVGRSETWKRDIAPGVLLDRAGIWRSRMTPGQAWLVAQATRSSRLSFGYTEVPGASVASIASAATLEARVRFEEARGSTGVVGAARHAGTVLKAFAV